MPHIMSRFQNIPQDSYITVIGCVQRRPDRLRNDSQETGGIEVHVENIVDILRGKKVYANGGGGGVGPMKRHFSTIAAQEEEPSRAITALEIKRAGKLKINSIQF